MNKEHGTFFFACLKTKEIFINREYCFLFSSNTDLCLQKEKCKAKGVETFKSQPSAPTEPELKNGKCEVSFRQTDQRQKNMDRNARASQEVTGGLKSDPELVSLQRKMKPRAILDQDQCKCVHLQIHHHLDRGTLD